MNDPQNACKLVGAVEMPPNDLSPSNKNGYIVILTQYGIMLVSSCLYISCESSCLIYSFAKSSSYISLILSYISNLLVPIISLLGNSPIQVVIFLFSTFAFESTSLTLEALVAFLYFSIKFIFVMLYYQIPFLQFLQKALIRYCFLLPLLNKYLHCLFLCIQFFYCP